MQSEFTKMIKDLADKNTEKEKDTKIGCDTWITQQMQKKDDQAIDAFFQYIRAQASQSTTGNALSLGAINAFGIFAYSIKSDEKLKEKYIDIIFDALIECYLLNDSNIRVVDNHKDQEDCHLESTKCNHDKPVARLLEVASNPGYPP